MNFWCHQVKSGKCDCEAFRIIPGVAISVQIPSLLPTHCQLRHSDVIWDIAVRERTESELVVVRGVGSNQVLILVSSSIRIRTTLLISRASWVVCLPNRK